MLKPVYFNDADSCAASIIDETDGRIVLGLPLGIGKPVQLVNALFRRACADRNLHLTIITALSLQPPQSSDPLERRFLEPLRQRLYARHPELEYVTALKAGRLPPNIEVLEFYSRPGVYIGAPQAQRNMLNTNYTHVVRDLTALGVNVIAQSVAQAMIGGELCYSLSCNPDITTDLLSALRTDMNRKVLVIGQVNSQLPFMGAASRLEPGFFDAILSGADYDYEPFDAISMPVDNVEHMIGLYASCLVRDGGTLQLGIGEIGDAVAHSINLRHSDNASYRRALGSVGAMEKFGDVIASCGGSEVFSSGLYGLTEMLGDGLWFLYRNGIIKRRVYSHPAEKTKGGVVIDAGFCLGSRGFYQSLRALDAATSLDIRMCPVSFTNELYGDDYALKRAQRVQARFINSGLKATLTGGIVSDTLDNGQVISGVGGQYNFVAMAHALPDARSVLTIRSTRGQGSTLESNIVWNYGHITIPRHLRDIVITEYGIADLRGKTDEQSIIELLKITDSRFQQRLLDTAQRAGKLRRDYALPSPFRNNYPEAIGRALSGMRRHFPEYPLGTDFTDVERKLLPALKNLKSLSRDKPALLKSFARAALLTRIPERLQPYLERMHLHKPRGLRERFWSRLLAGQLLLLEKADS
ncbi:MAG TPA: acetyl-CoA hydrolase/transferase C-terminal domain-containing protein [Gammaproteobacteria bacterium]|nr:acetyl-CoA hydrolase/transferase C-terminal domain-containing protein [Gammaproteobacteria bacterium]